MAFNRWDPRNKTSIAMNKFFAFHTDINNYLWAYFPARDHINYLAKSANIPPSSFFNVSEEEKRRLSVNMAEWKKNFREFDSWINLNTLMAASSYFETYLYTTSLIAIESDPGIQHGATRKIDGAIFLRHSEKYDVSHVVRGMWVGEWPKRLANFKAIFNWKPPTLDKETGFFERIRKIRNQVGHQFGRDGDMQKPRALISYQPLQKVSISTTIKYLSLIEAIAKEIDQRLLFYHIGNYEYLWLYHHYKSSYNIMHGARMFKKDAAKLNPPISVDAAKDIIKYYNSL